MSDKFDFDEIPDEGDLRNRVRGYIQSLRSEAAGYRTERNDFKEKYTEAGDLLKRANDKLTDAAELETKYQQSLTDNSKLNEQYDKLRAAAKHGISDEVDRLKGSNYDEWEADAESLAGKLSKKSTIPKDAAAGKDPKPPKDDPLTAAFREKGFL